MRPILPSRGGRIKAAGDLELIRKLNACSPPIDVFIPFDHHRETVPPREERKEKKGKEKKRKKEENERERKESARKRKKEREGEVVYIYIYI